MQKHVLGVWQHVNNYPQIKADEPNWQHGLQKQRFWGSQLLRPRESSVGLCTVQPPNYLHISLTQNSWAKLLTLFFYLQKCLVLHPMSNLEEQTLRLETRIQTEAKNWSLTTHRKSHKTFTQKYFALSKKQYAALKTHTYIHLQIQHTYTIVLGTASY